MLSKYIKICILSTALTLAFAACAKPSGIIGNGSAPSSSAAQDPDLIHLVKVEDILISSPKNTNSDVYESLTVQAGKLSKTFPWMNVTNPSYYPIVHLADIDDDDQNEIIIILTNGYGTGLNEQEIHVLNKEDLSELTLEDPLQAIKEQVTSQIIHDQDQVKVVVKTAGEKVEKTYNESDAVLWNEEVSFGSIIRYNVTDNIITATIPGGVSPAVFAVDINLEYGSNLKVKAISLEPIP